MGQIAAIFDLDQTLLAEASGKLIIRYLRRQGYLWQYFRKRDVLTILGAVMRYRLGLYDATQTLQAAARVSAGIDVEEFWQIVQRWFDDMLVPLITASGQQQVAWHFEQNHLPVICSGASQFSVHPVAEYLHIQHTVYTEWLTQDGKLTGEIRLPITYGLGKVHWMTRWAAAQNVDLTTSYFYTDHISDLPLLEQVGHPIAVNPDPRLRRIAQNRNWSIESW